MESGRFKYNSHDGWRKPFYLGDEFLARNPKCLSLDATIQRNNATRYIANVSLTLRLTNRDGVPYQAEITNTDHWRYELGRWECYRRTERRHNDHYEERDLWGADEPKLPDTNADERLAIILPPHWKSESHPTNPDAVLLKGSREGKGTDSKLVVEVSVRDYEGDDYVHSVEQELVGEDWIERRKQVVLTGLRGKVTVWRFDYQRKDDRSRHVQFVFQNGAYGYSVLFLFHPSLDRCQTQYAEAQMRAMCDCMVFNKGIR